jgi:leucyl/phenylalanyl-tRNA--protein transferase
MSKLSPQLVIQAYLQGYFPMADSRQGKLQWYTADPRAILPLDGLRIPRSLQQRIRRGSYRVTVDCAFGQVIQHCAQRHDNRPETWINQQIIEVYTQLHHMGIGHSVEAWDSQGNLVGGLYGLALGGAFFGESMFSRAVDASKVCLVKLVDHLNAQGYVLLDSQIGNDHMKQFGQLEVPLDHYLEKLEAALQIEPDWGVVPAPPFDHNAVPQGF